MHVMRDSYKQHVQRLVHKTETNDATHNSNERSSSCDQFEAHHPRVSAYEFLNDAHVAKIVVKRILLKVCKVQFGVIEETTNVCT